MPLERGLVPSERWAPGGYGIGSARWQSCRATPHGSLSMTNWVPSWSPVSEKSVAPAAISRSRSAACFSATVRTSQPRSTALDDSGIEIATRRTVTSPQVHQANRRASPGPATFSTHRPHSSGCSASRPTSSRWCQQRAHFSQLVAATTRLTSPGAKPSTGTASAGASAASWTAASEVMNTKRSSSPRRSICAAISDPSHESALNPAGGVLIEICSAG
mgnify:CR=1 FL=1